MRKPGETGVFLGDDRHLAVEQLVAAFDRVASGQSPELVCLVAPIGWGKTRIVQELYARLAADRQSEPAYWPPVIVDATDVVEPTRLRKRIYPGRFTTDGRAAPDWMWWGLSCERKADGRPAQAIEEAKPQLFVHAEAMEQRLGAVPRLRRRLGRDQVESGMAAVAGLLGVFVPPVGWAATVHDSVRQLWEAGQVVAEERRRRRRADTNRSVDAEESDRLALVEELADALVLVSGAPLNLPTVVVLDDAHDAADSAVVLADRLLASPRARILVVATAWPDELAVQAREGRGFGAWLDRVASDRVQRVELAPLDAVGLAALVRAAAPATPSPVIDALVARSGGNPFVLELMLSLGMVRRSIVHGAITLSAADLAVVPSELRRLYLAKWQELPEALRNVLAVASLQGAEFVAGCAHQGATAIGLAEAGDVLPEAVDPYAWVRELDDELRAFVEVPQFDVAAAEAGGALSAAELDAARRSLVAYVVASRQQEGWEALSTQARRTLLENHVRLAGQMSEVDAFEAGRSALELALILASEHRYAEAAVRGDEAMAWLRDEVEPTEALLVRAGAAMWVGEGGRPDEAVERLKVLVDEASRLLGPEDTVTLRLRSNLVVWLGEAGREVEALREGEQVVDRLGAVLGSDHPDTLTARVNLAVTLGECGHVEDALDQLQQVLADQVRVLGPDAPSAFATRSNLASFLAKSGRADESEAMSAELLVDQSRVLGADDPDTLLTRAHLAAHRDDGDDGSLLDDLLRVLGPEHPDALQARANEASAAIQAGRPEEAAVQLEAVYLDCVKALGASAPDTLTVRGNLVQALWDAGRLDDAAAHLAGLIQDQQGVLDPDDPDALWFREQLGRLLLEAGRFEEAAAVVSALTADRVRVLGPDHPDTLASRSHAAGALAQTGRLDEALAAYMALAEDCQRVLGADHPDTLVVLAGFAEAAAAAGLVSEARAILGSVVERRARVLGEDDPDTIASRQRLRSLDAQNPPATS